MVCLRTPFVCALALSAALVAPPVLAQSGPTTTITYEPLVANVPSLSEWGLMALVGMMAFAAFRVMRRGAPGRLLSLLALGAVAAIAASPWATPAMAVPPLALTSPVGGTAVWTGTGEIGVPNNTSVPLRIVSVQVENAAAFSPEGSPICAAGVVLNPGQLCYIGTAGFLD